MVLVILTDSGRSGAMRVDLAPFRDPATRTEATAQSAILVKRLPGVRAVIPVVYTDEPFGSEGEVPHADMIVRVITGLTDDGLDVVDALCVGPDGWASYLDHDGTGGRRELAEIEAVDCWNVRPVLEAAQELSVPRAPSAASAGRGRLTPERYARFVATERGRAALIDVADRALARSHDREDRRTLATALGAPVLRDAVICAWAWGSDAGCHILRRVFEPEQFSRAIEEDPWMYALAGSVDVDPSPERLHRATRTVKRVCELLPESERAPEYACLSWLYWALGYCSFAKVWAARAADLDEDYSFASLMQEVVARGILPEWAWLDRPVD